MLCADSLPAWTEMQDEDAKDEADAIDALLSAADRPDAELTGKVMTH